MQTHRMYPMTITGIVECMKALKDKKLNYQTSKERQQAATVCRKSPLRECTARMRRGMRKHGAVGRGMMIWRGLSRFFIVSYS